MSFKTVSQHSTANGTPTISSLNAPESARLEQPLLTASDKGMAGEGATTDFKREAWVELAQAGFPPNIRPDVVEGTARYLLSDLNPASMQSNPEIARGLLALTLFAMAGDKRELMAFLGAKIAHLPLPEDSMVRIAKDFAAIQEHSALNSSHLSDWISWFSTSATDAVYDELMTGLTKRIEHDEVNLDHIIAVFAKSVSPYAKKLWQETIDVNSVAYPVKISDLPTKDLVVGILETAPGTSLIAVGSPLVAAGLLNEIGVSLPTGVQVVFGCALAGWFTVSSLKEAAIRCYKSNNPTRPIALAARLPEGNNDALEWCRERYDSHKSG